MVVIKDCWIKGLMGGYLEDLFYYGDVLVLMKVYEKVVVCGKYLFCCYLFVYYEVVD